MEVLQKVKSQYPEVKVIILTGHGTQKDVDRAIALGASNIFKKPVDIDALLDSIKKAYKGVERMMTAVSFAEAGEADTAREYLKDKEED